MVASGGEDTHIRVWDTESGKEVKVLKGGHTDSPKGLVFTPNKGSEIVSCGLDNNVCVWNVSSGGLVATLKGHEGCVTGIALFPGAAKAVTCSFDKTLRVWDLTGKKEVLKIDNDRAFRCVCISPDCSKIVAGGSGQYSGVPVPIVQGQASVRGGSIRMYDASTGTELQNIQGHTLDVCGLAFAPCGTKVASCSWDGSLRLWEVTSESRPLRPALVIGPVAVPPRYYDCTGTLGVRELPKKKKPAQKPAPKQQQQQAPVQPSSAPEQQQQQQQQQQAPAKQQPAPSPQPKPQPSPPPQRQQQADPMVSVSVFCLGFHCRSLRWRPGVNCCHANEHDHTLKVVYVSRVATRDAPVAAAQQLQEPCTPISPDLRSDSSINEPYRYRCPPPRRAAPANSGCCVLQ
eukprot:Hpha_TRINITY_DN15517_c2_g5::TRINITY_DN15517_c2_g5_i3::g.107171::m.107171